MKLVIFDLDGVIVSKDMYHYSVWKSLADESNLLFSYEINHMLRGVSRAESLKIILDFNCASWVSQKFTEMMNKKTEHTDKIYNPLKVMKYSLVYWN